MRLLGRNLSRRDLIPVGAALLLPVPLVALNGYAAGWPDAVGRGLGSVITLDAKDGRNGIEAGGRAAETGSDTQRSGRGTLKVTRSRGAGLAGLGVVPSGSAGRRTGRSANGKEPEQTPRGSAPDSGGDTGGSGPSGGSAPATGSNSSSTPTGSPSLSVMSAGQGTGTSLSAGGNGLTIDLGADSAGGDEPAGATVTVTDTGGAPTSLNVGGPGSVVSLP
jgi:hypothetical protein